MHREKNPTITLLFLLGLTGITVGQFALADDDDDDDDRRETPCERTAETMFKACMFDVGDNLHTTIAHCRNLSNSGERGACREEARETREEEFELCGEIEEAREDACELLGEHRYDPDPLTGISPLDGTPITFLTGPELDSIGGSIPENPYFSLKPGRTQVLRAGDPDGVPPFAETIVVHVTDMTREIFPDPDDETLSVFCRVVVDIVVEDGEAVEVTDDWYAQSSTGDVYYCGELARNFEDGVLRDLDGSFEAGRDFAKAGLLISANPSPGFSHRQEFLLGEAEDVILYASTTAIPTAAEGGQNPNPAFQCTGAEGGCVKTEEFIPPDPESGEFKYYLSGVGFVLGVALENGEVTGDRDELVCLGDSLDILTTDPSCAIDEPAELLEELCTLSPDAFCD